MAGLSLCPTKCRVNTVNKGHVLAVKREARANSHRAPPGIHQTKPDGRIVRQLGSVTLGHVPGDVGHS
jgi:hypothetical protein